MVLPPNFKIFRRRFDGREERLIFHERNDNYFLDLYSTKDNVILSISSKPLEVFSGRFER